MKTLFKSFIIFFIFTFFTVSRMMGQPSVAAPVPIQEASDVVSVFSDYYVSSIKEFKPLDWNPSIAEIMKIEGTSDNIAKIPNLGDCPINISTWKIQKKATIHMDVYWESGKGTFTFGLSNSYGANPTLYPQAVDYTWPELKQGQWVGIDIPIKVFEDQGLGLNGIVTMRFKGSGTFYIDNFYAYGEPEPASFVIPQAPTPIHNAEEVSCVFSDYYTTVAKFEPQNWPPAKLGELKKIAGTDDTVLRVEYLGDSPIFVNTWNIADKGIIRMDVYYEGDGDGSGLFYFSFANEWSGKPHYYPHPSEYKWKAAKKGEWVTLEISTKAYAELGLDLTQVRVLRLIGSGTYCIDNVYAYGEYGDEPIEPKPEKEIDIERAKLPIHFPENVVSVYSDRYTSAANLEFRDETIENLKIKDKNDYVLSIPELNETILSVNTWKVPSDAYIHMDVYHLEGGDGSFNFELASNDNNYKSPVNYIGEMTQQGKWISIDIAAADFVASGLNIDNIQKIKLKGSGSFYIDNLYAYVSSEDDGEFNVRTQFGVNLAGAEFSGNAFYPTNADDWDYYQEKGLNLIRVPFKWERIQPTLNGELSMEDLEKLKLIANMAKERGMQLMLDMHNYCRRKVDGKDLIIDATPNLTRAHLADVWQKLAIEFKDLKIWGYDIMNEPHDMGNSSWKEIAQEVINAIRTVDARTPIIIEGNSWASASKWATASNELRELVDPSDRIIFQAHCYFDSNESGVYSGTYDAEVSDSNAAIVRLRSFVNWLRKNNEKGVIGELGCPGDDERWLNMLDGACEYLKKNNVSLTYWAGGRHWANSYKLNIHPNTSDFSIEKPQMSILEKYSDFNNVNIDNIAKNNNAPLIIYPNPVQNRFEITSEQPLRHVQVYNFMGQMIYSQILSGTVYDYEVNAFSFAPGNYLIRVKTETDEILTSKIVKL